MGPRALAGMSRGWNLVTGCTGQYHVGSIQRIGIVRDTTGNFINLQGGAGFGVGAASRCPCERGIQWETVVSCRPPESPKTTKTPKMTEKTQKTVQKMVKIPNLSMKHNRKIVNPTWYYLVNSVLNSVKTRYCIIFAHFNAENARYVDIRIDEKSRKCLETVNVTANNDTGTLEWHLDQTILASCLIARHVRSAVCRKPSLPFLPDLPAWSPPTHPGFTSSRHIDTTQKILPDHAFLR